MFLYPMLAIKHPLPVIIKIMDLWMSQQCTFAVQKVNCITHCRKTNALSRLGKVILNPFITHFVMILGISWALQDLALAVFELHEFQTGSPLKPLEFSVDGMVPLAY